MPETSRHIALDVIADLRREIQENDGNELFAVLRKDEEDDLYGQLEVICRGTQSEVPALVSRVRPGDMTVHNHPSGVLTPSQADMNMASIFGEEGVGSMIVDNEVAHCRVIVEPSFARKVVPVDNDEVSSFFGPQGPLAEKLEGYESRSGQVRMAASVAENISNGGVLVVEAGTGTGKSLAYMIPAMLWAKKNQGRVLIATKTIALQEQLVFKDIPLARKAVPNAPLAALVKGRGNYVCLRKLNDLQSNQMSLPDLDTGGVEKEIEDIGAWVEETGSGDLADLPFKPSMEAWDLVRSDADMCLGIKCPFYQKAPFFESRRQAARARILVVNQALLFADLSVRGQSENYNKAAVIPPYDHVILDEAHSTEDIATDHFGEKVSSFGLKITLGKMLRFGRSNSGVISRLVQAAAQSEPELADKLSMNYVPRFQDLQGQVLNQLAALTYCLHDTFNPDNSRHHVVWLKENILSSPRIAEAKKEAKTLLELVYELQLVAKNIKAELTDEALPTKFHDRIQGMIIEYDARCKRLQALVDALKNFAVRSQNNQILWLELRNRRSQEFDYRISPLNVAPMLVDYLYKPFKSITLTSATLDIRDQFKFFRTRAGLHLLEGEKEPRHLSVESPFDYKEQSKLFLTKMPSGPTHRNYIRELCEVIFSLATSPYPGGTLVLFTAYSMLNMVARELEGPLSSAGVPLMVQGWDQRSALIKRMKETQGVLLGTDSFWEGVDLPGMTLTKVVIAKLPFRQVADPVFEARCTDLENQGHSSFRELSLPLAMLKFKQGIGRLIRSRKDKGVLIVADNRIQEKPYGKKFLKLVDMFPVVQINQKELETEVRQQGPRH